jgi:hypothetical protein
MSLYEIRIATACPRGSTVKSTRLCEYDSPMVRDELSVLSRILSALLARLEALVAKASFAT